MFFVVVFFLVFFVFFLVFFFFFWGGGLFIWLTVCDHDNSKKKNGSFLWEGPDQMKKKNHIHILDLNLL